MEKTIRLIILLGLVAHFGCGSPDKERFLEAPTPHYQNKFADFYWDNREVIAELKGNFYEEEELAYFKNTVDSKFSTNSDSLMVLASNLGYLLDIDYRYIYALWVQESNLNPHAMGDYRQGKPKAFGLGQVWIETAEYLMRRPVTREELLDPVYGGFISALYLKYCLNRVHEESMIYALSAYNMGPSRAIYAQTTGKVPQNINYVREVKHEASGI